MTELEERTVAEQIKKLVPHYSMIEFRAAVSLSSYTIEFYVTLNGRKMQCYEMIEEGFFSEEEFNDLSKTIAHFFREQPDFQEGKRNIYTLTINNPW